MLLFVLISPQFADAQILSPADKARLVDSLENFNVFRMTEERAVLDSITRFKVSEAESVLVSSFKNQMPGFQIDFLDALISINSSSTDSLAHWVIDSAGSSVLRVFADEFDSLYVRVEATERLLQLNDFSTDGEYMRIFIRDSANMQPGFILDFSTVYFRGGPMADSVVNALEFLAIHGGKVARKFAATQLNIINSPSAQSCLATMAVSDSDAVVRMFVAGFLVSDQYGGAEEMLLNRLSAEPVVSSRETIAGLLLENYCSPSNYNAVEYQEAVDTGYLGHVSFWVMLQVFTPPNSDSALSYSVKLDSLVSAKEASAGYGWIHNAAWVTELDSLISAAASYTLNGDPVNASRTLRVFQAQVDTVYADSLNPQNSRTITREGWLFMHYKSQYIIASLPVPPPQYLLAVAAAGNGSVTVSPDTSVLDSGAIITLTAVPEQGYEFTGWSGDATGSTNPLIFQIASGVTDTGWFAQSEYSVRATSYPGGLIYQIDTAISYSDTTEIDTFVVPSGQDMSFYIDTVAGYFIDSLVVDDTLQTPQSTYTFTDVSAPHTISAAFQIYTYPLTASAVNGTINPAGTTNVDYGATQRYTFSPDSGYQFDTLYVDGVANTDSTTGYTFSNVTTSHTISVTFTPSAYWIFATSNPGGLMWQTDSTIQYSDTAEVDTFIVDAGNSLTLHANTAAGCYLDSLMVDDTLRTLDSTYTFPDVAAQHTITASFAIYTYTLAASAGANGSISPSGTTTVNYGTNQIYTVAPNTGYHIDSILVDGSYVGNTSPDTMKNVRANHTVTATFGINTYTLTSSAGANGSVSPSGATQVNYGINEIYSVTPNTGYHIDSILVDGVLVGSTSPDTIKNVMVNHTVTATFGINTYTVTSSAGANGTISPNGATVVNYGTNEIYTITASAGYHIDSILVDGVYVGHTSLDTVKNVTANHTVTATFGINTYTLTSSAGANGTISPNGATVVNYGTNEIYTIIPSTGYHIDSILVDGAYVGHTSPDTVKNVIANHTITATFGINTYTVTSTAGANGSISPSGASVVNYGANEIYTVTPNSCYHIDSILVDGSYVGHTSPDTVKNVTANHTVTVTFGIVTDTLTSSAGANGSITPSGSIVANCGANKSFVFSPNTCYQFDTLYVDGVARFDSTTGFTFSDITAAHTISVRYKIAARTFTPTWGSNGTGSPLSVTTKNCGDTLVVVASPNLGYKLGSWSGDTSGGIYGGDTLRLVMNINRNVTGTFVLDHNLTVPGEFSTIASAIKFSRLGDTVSVSPGTYSEFDTVAAKDTLVIQALGSTDQVTNEGFYIQKCKTLTIKRFDIDATGTSKDGIRLEGTGSRVYPNTDVSLESVLIKNSSRNGILLGNENYRIRIANARIYSNNQDGIQLTYPPSQAPDDIPPPATGSYYIINSTIVNNGGSGVQITYGFQTYLVNNILSYNGTNPSLGTGYGISNQAYTAGSHSYSGSSYAVVYYNLVTKNNGATNSTSTIDLSGSMTYSSDFSTYGTEGSGVTQAPNFNMSDLFVSVSPMNCHLKSSGTGTFVVNAGENSWSPPDAAAGAIPTTDFDGNARPYPTGGTVDLGADELEY